MSDGIFSMLGSIGGAVANYFSNRETNKSNERIANDTNEMNYRLWKENNEYNTPAAQMARYRAAGINPNQVVGSIGNGNSSSPAQYERVNKRAFTGFGDFGASNMAQLFQQRRVNDSTIRLQDSQKDKNDAETVNTQAKTLNEYRDGKLKEITFLQKELDYLVSSSSSPYQIEMARVRLDQARKDLSKTDSEIDKLKSSIDVDKSVSSLNDVRKDILPREISVAEMNAATARINALSNKDRNEVLNRLTSAQEREISSLLPIKYANMLLEGDKLDKEYLRLAIDNDYQQFKRRMAKNGFNIESDSEIQSIMNLLRVGIGYVVETFMGSGSSGVLN